MSIKKKKKEQNIKNKYFKSQSNIKIIIKTMFNSLKKLIQSSIQVNYLSSGKLNFHFEELLEFNVCLACFTI